MRASFSNFFASVWLALLVAAGCDGTPGSDPENGLEGIHASGSRLRARLLDGGDGALFVGWYDSELKEPCQFAPAIDGKLRCLPGEFSQLFYKDAACEERVASPPECGPLSNYVKDSHHDSCDGVTMDVYKVGDKSGKGAVYLKSAATGECKIAGDDKDHYSVTEVPLSSFVSATSSDQARGERLTVTVLEGEDGSRQVRQPLKDIKEGVSCSPVEFGGLRCMPSDLAAADTSSFFEDAACTEPVIVNFEPSACPAPKFARGSASVICGMPAVQVVEVAKPISGTEVYGLTCTLLPPAVINDFAFFEIGSPVDPGRFSEVVMKQQGTGRLAVQYYATEQGDALGEPFTFHDTTLDVDCHAFDFADGTLRCVPLGSGVQLGLHFSTYQDAACSKPLQPVFADAPGCFTAPPKYVITPSSTAQCGEIPLVHVNPVGPLFTEEVVYLADKMGGCQAMMQSEATKLYELGPDLDPNVFAKVARTIE